MLLSPGERLGLRGSRQSLALEIAHLGAVLLLLAQVIGVERLVLLLEHLQVGLVVAFELAVLVLLLGSLLVLILPVEIWFNHVCL